MNYLLVPYYGPFQLVIPIYTEGLSHVSKKLTDGRESVYLDCYLPNAAKKRHKEYLKIYTYRTPRNTKEREHDKKTMLLAESIRSKRFMDIQHNQHGFGHLVESVDSVNFINYFKTVNQFPYTSFF